MKHGSLFNGIGGFQLAAAWMGWENIFSCEIDNFCNQVTKKHFPDCIQHGDIKTTDFSVYRGRVDIVTGGPPCQPTSQAGKRKGESDNRWLWPEAVRVFGEIMPRVGVFENPDDLLTLDNGEPFERICSSLEDFGYTVETYGVPAACVGAWHERDRIWIIAYANNFSNPRELDVRTNPGKAKTGKGANPKERKALDGKRLWTESNPGAEIISNINPPGLQSSAQRKFRSISQTTGTPSRSDPGRTYAEIGAYWETEPGVVRMVHGLPGRVDRIKALGNAIVPQVAYQIFKAIEQTNERL